MTNKSEPTSKSTLTRRALVASTAAMPAAAALGLPVAQATEFEAEPDPIFALIEEYRRAYAQHAADVDAQGAFESLHEPRPFDYPEWGEREEQITLASNAEAEAARKLCHTAPTTLAGLAAVLSFVIDATESGDDILQTYTNDEHKDDDGEEDSIICLWPFFRTLLRSAEQLTGHRHEQHRIS